jgi:hypothetical protein
MIPQTNWYPSMRKNPDALTGVVLAVLIAHHFWDLYRKE